MENWRDTLQSEYANSPTLTQLLQNFNDYIDPTTVMDDFYDIVWNIDTAEGFGLDIWGRIVGVTRVLQIANEAVNGPFFGFAQDFNAETLNNGVFYNPNNLIGPLLVNYDLPDDDYRTLILAKAFTNISDGSIPSVNTVLMTLFSEGGNCYVIDNADMSLTYQFDFTPSLVQQAIIFQSGVLPSPAGIVVRVAAAP